MTFLVIFVSLLVERFFDWSHLRIWHWFVEFQRRIIDKFRQPSGYVNLAIAIAPVLLAVWLIDHFLHGCLYNFPLLIFRVIILLYAFGPHNLWADAFGCINAVTEGDAEVATARLKNAFGANARSTSTLHTKLLNDIFIAANRRLFAVIFWFLLLGPIGAIFYRLVAVSTGVQEGKFDSVKEISAPAQMVESVLDWVPARIITIFFALGGHFMQVLDSWRKNVARGLYSNDDLMIACGLAALGVNKHDDMPDDCANERAALSLIDRSLVIVLVVIGLVWLI
jgi:AmpE protein